MRQVSNASVPFPLRTELERANVLRILEEDGNARIVALFAPSGYGKTTLLAMIARASTKRTIWMSIADQISASQFCSELVDAVRARAPNCELTHFENCSKQQITSAGVASALARDLNSSDDNFVFFLDRVDSLDTDTCRWVEAFIKALGEGHQVFLAGYGTVPLKLSQFVAQGLALIIGRDQLAFSIEETQAYLTARGYADSVVRAHEQLDGWPAGLAFVASGANPILHPADLVLDALESLPPPIRQVLCEMGVVETWSEDVALDLGVALPRGWLHVVRHSGLPVSPLSYGVVRPHRLMLEVLEKELRLETNRASTVYTRAAQLAIRDHDYIKAVRHYLNANREDEALQLASDVVSQAAAKWEPRRLRALLEALPIQRLPQPLKAALGQALLDTGESNRGEAMLRNIASAGQPDQATLSALALIAARQGKHDQQLGLLEQALKLPLSAEQTRKIQRSKASAYAGLGRLEEALALVLECVRQAESVGDLSETAAALDVAEYIYASLGHHFERERVVVRALEICLALEMPLRVIALKSSLAEVCLTTNRVEEASLHVNAALLIAEREDHPLLVKLLETRGDLQFSQLQFAEATADYEAALEACRRFGREGVAVRLLLKLSDVFRQLHEPSRAETLLERASAYGIPEASAQLRAEHLFVTGQALFEAEQFEAARDCFEQVLATSLEPMRLLRAELFLAELDHSKDIPVVQRLQALDARLKLVPIQTLLQLDSDALIEVHKYLRNQNHGEMPSQIIPSLVSVKTAKPTLEITAIGRFEAKIDAQSVAIPIAKSAELLVWFALHGCARREAIMDALWDGSNERRHAEYFRFAVRRLRSSLSEHPAVVFNPVPFEAEYYQISDQFQITVDALSLTSEAIRYDANEAEQLLLRLDGTFMPMVDSEWVQPWRTRLESATSSLALDTANYLSGTDVRRAITIYQRTIERDPFNEDAQAGMIELYQKLGDHRKAQRILATYQKLLRDEMNEDLPKRLAALIQVP